MADAHVEGKGSVGRVIATRGRAALLSSVTTGVGFGCLVQAEHHGGHTLGAAAIIGVFWTCFFTTLVLPALLALREPPGGNPHNGPLTASR